MDKFIALDNLLIPISKVKCIRYLANEKLVEIDTDEDFHENLSLPKDKFLQQNPSFATWFTTKVNQFT